MAIFKCTLRSTLTAADLGSAKITSHFLKRAGCLNSRASSSGVLVLHSSVSRCLRTDYAKRFVWQILTIRPSRLAAKRFALTNSPTACRLLNIPPSEKWDLVVGNPPFYPETHATDICSHDKDWHIHRGFFANVGRFLKPGGVILLQEANESSTAETFRDMIEEAGLSIVLVHGSKPGKGGVFFMGVIRQGETPPAWLTAAASVSIRSSWSDGPAYGPSGWQPWSA
jgi:hypothetical protein